MRGRWSLAGHLPRRNAERGRWSGPLAGRVAVEARLHFRDDRQGVGLQWRPIREAEGRLEAHDLVLLGHGHGELLAQAVEEVDHGRSDLEEHQALPQSREVGQGSGQGLRVFPFRCHSGELREG